MTQKVLGFRICVKIDTILYISYDECEGASGRDLPIGMEA